MRLLILCGAGTMYGKEAVTLSLIEGLFKRGHEILCLTSSWSDGKFERKLNELSINNRQLALGFLSKTFSRKALWMSLAQMCRLPSLWWGYRTSRREFRPDVVLHSTMHHAVLLWPFLGQERNVFHVHDCFAPSSFYKRLFTVLASKFDIFVGVSKFIAGSLVQLGIPTGKIAYVLNGIPAVNSDSRARKIKESDQPNIETRPVRIGIVGQVGEWKGHEDLIEALRILAENQGNFVCRIFGEGSLEFSKKLKTQIEDYKLTNHVEWMGFVDDRKLIYEGMDVCVVPSRRAEPFGLVAAEAILNGIPVVASRIGGLPEIVVREELGYLVDARSPDQIANRISRISYPLEQRTKTNPIQKHEVHTLLSAERMVLEMDALLQSLVNEPQFAGVPD